MQPQTFAAIRGLGAKPNDQMRIDEAAGVLNADEQLGPLASDHNTRGRCTGLFSQHGEPASLLTKDQHSPAP
jgi:hypothetical protein